MSERNGFDIGNFRQALRAEKAAAVNELGKQSAMAILEMSRRMDLRPDETAYALIGAVCIVVRNRGGVKLLPKNLRSIAGKLYDYANMLERKDARPTDEILPT